MRPVASHWTERSRYPIRCPVKKNSSYDLDHELLLFEQKLPRVFARLIDWVRRPTSRLVRLPLGCLLVVGGLLGFLPIFGFWMLPLGLLLIARDVPAIEPPLARFFAWINRNFPSWNTTDKVDQPPR